MTDHTQVPRFTGDEYQRRAELTQQLMDKNELAALIIYATAYGGDNIRWLTGFAPRHDTFLACFADREAVLLTQLFNHLPNARRVAVTADVRWGGPDSAESLVSLLQECGVHRGRVGLIGRVPYTDYQQFASALPQIDWISVDHDYRTLRLVKSNEELEWLRQGAAHTDSAMAALAAAAAPGVTEHELVAAIEAAYTPAGGQHGIHFLSSMPMATPTSYVPAQTQSSRILQSGDVIISELSAGVGGYSGQIHRPLSIGQLPSSHYQRLFDVALEAYQRIIAVLKPGATVGQVLDAADYIERQGLTVCDDLLHGFGMGYLPPALRTRATAHSKQPPDNFTLEQNMAIVVQPNVYDPDNGSGLQVGNLLVIGANGVEEYQSFPMEFRVCPT